MDTKFYHVFAVLQNDLGIYSMFNQLLLMFFVLMTNIHLISTANVCNYNEAHHFDRIRDKLPITDLWEGEIGKSFWEFKYRFDFTLIIVCTLGQKFSGFIFANAKYSSEAFGSVLKCGTL